MSDFTQEQLRTLLIARENEIDRLHARVTHAPGVFPAKTQEGDAT